LTLAANPELTLSAEEPILTLKLETALFSVMFSLPPLRAADLIVARLRAMPFASADLYEADSSREYHRPPS